MKDKKLADLEKEILRKIEKTEKSISQEKRFLRELYDTLEFIRP